MRRACADAGRSDTRKEKQSDEMALRYLQVLQRLMQLWLAHVKNRDDAMLFEEARAPAKTLMDIRQSLRTLAPDGGALRSVVEECNKRFEALEAQLRFLESHFMGEL